MNNGLQHSIISLWPVYSIRLQFLSAVEASFRKVREGERSALIDVTAPEFLRFPFGPEPPSVCVSALMIDSAIWRIDDKRVRSHFTDLLSGILLHMCTKVALAGVAGLSGALRRSGNCKGLDLVRCHTGGMKRSRSAHLKYSRSSSSSALISPCNQQGSGGRGAGGRETAQTTGKRSTPEKQTD
ncbi:hypothetical protein DPX16_3396 [Anabarilius grahami]|uniref:Uncharacterized protein n=1 Tax=Anabarilius grahami TaxID=495550 RepID=A0A3N0XLI6_ANAGA|nr:hypothetical protein DPX16_3396 [Anabarilius grahami]